MASAASPKASLEARQTQGRGLALNAALGQSGAMKRIIFLYALALGVAAFLLAWLEYKYVARVFAPEIYILLIAAAFTALGVWAGHKLTQKPAPASFQKNHAALRSLGVSAREYEVLEHLAKGQTNKEIARALELSPNTVKTHLSSLYEKLGARRRTRAIQIAKEHALIP